MSRISGLHIGIEHLSEVDSAHDLAGLPERYVLPPDGHSVEAHFDALYPARRAEQQWLDLARPSGHFHELLRPQAFRQALAQLRQTLEASPDPHLHAAAQLIAARSDDEQLLRMALNLLHKV